MATLQSAITFARAQAQTNSTGLTDANAIIFANSALLDIHRTFIKEGVDASGIQESYQDGTINVGTYLYPSDMFFLKAIELNYTDTSAFNYKTAQQIDVSNITNQLSFSYLRQNASPNYPEFDDRGDWFEIFPTPTSANNVSQLMRIFYFLKPTEFTATSDTIVYPESLDYRILGWGIAAYYLYSLMKMNEGKAFMDKAVEVILSMKNTLGRGTQQPTTATSISITGWEF
jgi:hypothetical protein